MTHPLIIIGAGLAGWTTVREFRKLDSTTPVLMLTADSGDFYAKPSLSNAFAQGRAPAQLVTTPAATMSAAQGVTLLPHTRVESIDTAAQTVGTPGARLHYSQLVLATGAQPIRVPLAGDAADAVFSVNSLDDFSAFHAWLTAADAHRQRILIMGAGLIGCEFANDLAAAGYAVSVVDPSPRPLSALLPEAAGEQLRDALAALGVRWHFGATVTAVSKASGDEHPAFNVLLSSGEAVGADAVLSAIGLRANTALASVAGLACGRGILVDTALRCSRPNIYALGDAAQYASAPGQAGQGSLLPYVMPLMNAARALAATLSGRRTELTFPLMPVTIKTPALPLVVASPAAGQAGQWQEGEPGIWQFMAPDGQPRGFVLAGKQSARRAEQVRLIRG